MNHEIKWDEKFFCTLINGWEFDPPLEYGTILKFMTSIYHLNEPIKHEGLVTGLILMNTLKKLKKHVQLIAQLLVNFF